MTYILVFNTCAAHVTRFLDFGLQMTDLGLQLKLALNLDVSQGLVPTWPTMVPKMNSYTALRPLCSWRIALGAFQYVFDVCKCAASWFGFHHFLYGRIRVSIVVGILVRILVENLERILVDTALPSSNSPQPEQHLGALSCLLQLQYHYF